MAFQKPLIALNNNGTVGMDVAMGQYFSFKAGCLNNFGFGSHLEDSKGVNIRHSRFGSENDPKGTIGTGVYLDNVRGDTIYHNDFLHNLETGIAVEM